MTERLAGKIALVTGASRGLGARQAERLAREGALVIVTDVLDERGADLAKVLASSGAAVRYQRLDVASVDDWQAIVEQAEQRHGGLDILVNNAGVTVRAGVCDTTIDDWRRVLDINLTGAFLGIQAVAPLMKRKGAGSIINICSVAAFATVPFTAYTASKWGVRGLAKSAALELAPWNVRVNCVCPGPVLTELGGGSGAVTSRIPMNRRGTADDIANAVVFLASDDASYVTGADIAVDGGIALGAFLEAAP